MRFRLATSLLFMLALAACSSGPTRVESDLGIKGAPDWVNEGSQALSNRDDRLFHGVGQAPPMGDPSLQQSTADSRARAEIARSLDTLFDLAGSDYLASSGAGGDDRTTAQSVSQQIRSSTQLHLSGARIIARWKDPRTGAVYSLAELDMKAVDRALELSRDMNESARRYLQQNADNIFDRMLEEESR